MKFRLAFKNPENVAEISAHRTVSKFVSDEPHTGRNSSTINNFPEVHEENIYRFACVWKGRARSIEAEKMHNDRVCSGMRRKWKQMENFDALIWNKKNHRCLNLAQNF
ncbi:hypothetical protein Q1695_012363 [Nippostrongylus brasiliensis]|nr:hypothetical protein Q1695_012363 [Nippostrongylus brasiliensis]